MFKKKDLKYCTIGKEIGKKCGTPHLQGFVHLTNKKRFNTIKTLVGNRAHIEAARGDDESNRGYTGKEDKNPFILGEPCPAKQGERTDIHEAVECLKKTKSMKALAEQYPVAFVKYHRGFEKILLAWNGNEEQRHRAPKVSVFIGPSGTGKSRLAQWEADKISQQMMPEASYADRVYHKQRSELWWDGYKQQPCVILDDFYGWIRWGDILQILDRFPYQVQSKGGQANFNSPFIWITSNKEIEEWYRFEHYDPTPLYRRLHSYVRIERSETNEQIHTSIMPQSDATKDIRLRKRKDFAVAAEEEIELWNRDQEAARANEEKRRKTSHDGSERTDSETDGQTVLSSDDGHTESL